MSLFKVNKKIPLSIDFLYKKRDKRYEKKLTPIV